MVGLTAERTAPEELPRASISLTILKESSSATLPKTTCLPSSHEVGTVVMKNWEPLLQRSQLGNMMEDLSTANLRVGTSVGHGEQTGAVVLVDEVLVGELLTVDGLATSALYPKSSQSDCSLNQLQWPSRLDA